MSTVSDNPSHNVVARYFQMWNTGDSSIAADVLSAEWIDHAHPEVTSPSDVQRAVEGTRATQPNLRFDIQAILGENDLIAVAGEVHLGPGTDTPPSRLVWLVRLTDGRMSEMWTYHQNHA